MTIPFKTCNKAADLLIEWFSDPDELHKIVGGEKWWQVRGLDGVEGEWVTEKSFIRENDVAEKVKVKQKDIGRPLSSDEVDILKMDKLETVMVSLPELLC